MVRQPRAFWLETTLTGALALTVFDALLLQKAKAFFTGGFLSPLHTSGPLDAAGFLVTSVLVDAGLLGLIAALVLWLTSRLRLTPAARAAAVLIGAVSPFLFMDFVSYKLLTYLGDAFDLSLMFDLTGRRTDEIVAVASSQLLQLGGLTLLALVVVVVVVWGINRFGPGAPHPVPAPVRRLIAPATALFALGLLLTCTVSVASETFDDGLSRKASGGVYDSIVATLSDVDCDGFGLLGGMRDVNLFDSAVYPWAVDVPGNGIDEDGVGGDLPADTPAYIEGQHAAAAGWRQRPDVVLFVLESFRADAVGRRVNGLPVTPVLDGLALEGVSSAHAFSHNGYTAQSRFHLMTGSLAGLRGGTSLIDDFAANGYETAYFSAQDESFGGPALGVGFDRASVHYDARQDRGSRYSTFSTPGSLAVSWKTLEARVHAFLEQRSRERPLFLYVNFHDTHYPYHHDDIAPLVSKVVLPPSDIAPSNGPAVQEMYFNAAANVDRAIGQVIADVTGRMAKPPAVIVMSDHGESLFDGNFLGHGYALNDVQTRVPFIARGLPLIVREPFGQADLRDAIGEALSCDPGGDERPRFLDLPGKRVFQYLGNINRPRQIGFESGQARIIYDFRQRRVRTADTAEWRHPDELTDAERPAFLELIHYWERMMVARAAR